MTLPFSQQCINQRYLTMKLITVYIISSWAYKRKISFSPDKNKQVPKVIFLKVQLQADHDPLLFDNILVSWTPAQKYLGLSLNEKLNFQHHIKDKIKKISHETRVIHKYLASYPMKHCLQCTNHLSGSTLIMVV